MLVRQFVKNVEYQKTYLTWADDNFLARVQFFTGSDAVNQEI